MTETADTYNIPISAAAFRVIEEIEDYRKTIGLKKEISRLAVQIFTMNEFLGRKNNAVMALMKLQSLGVTEDQILRFFEECNLGSNKYKMRLICSNSSVFFDTKKKEERWLFTGAVQHFRFYKRISTIITGSE